MNYSALLLFQNLRIPKYQQDVADCAAVLMNKYSEVQSSIVYENIGRFVDIVLRNEMYNSTRIINIKRPLEYRKGELEPYYMLTVIIENIDELEKYFNAIYRVLGWNSRSKHFIIYVGNEDIDRIFELSWDKFLIQLIVLDAKSNLYTYYPLEKCGKVIKKHFLSHCNNLNFTILDNLYDGDRINEYQQCPINILTTKLAPYVIDVKSGSNPGFEIKALNELSKALNFTVNYIQHNFSYWGYKTKDNTYTDMYNILFQRKADLMLGMVAANGTFLYDFDSSIAHTKSDLTFYVPAAKRVHPWKNIVKVYHQSIWILMLVIAVVMSIVWFIIAKLQENSEGFESYTQCVLYVIGICFNESMKQPVAASFRYLFIIWTFYNLILTSTFEGSLVSFLTKPNFEKEINTFQDLMQSDLRIGGYEYAKELFNLNEYNSIYENWIDCDINELCMNETAFKGDLASLYDVRQVNYLTRSYYTDENGKSLLHEMPVVSSYFMWILMLKGFPLRNAMDRMIQRFTENGLMEKWMRDVSHNIPPGIHVDEVQLQFEHIVFAICVLAGGLSLALITFIGELVYFHVIVPRKQKSGL